MSNTSDLTGRSSGMFPFVKYRPNDIEAWRIEMYDMFLSLGMDYVVSNEFSSYNHNKFCDSIEADSSAIKADVGKRKFLKLQARANTMLRLATGPTQHRLIRGFGSETCFPNKYSYPRRN